MTQLAVIQDIFARYGVKNFHPIDGDTVENDANFTVFFGADDVVALINWKTLAEDLKRVGVVDGNGNLKSWRYDEIHGYFIHLSKSEISRLKTLEGSIALEVDSKKEIELQSKVMLSEDEVLRELNQFGFHQIKSVSFVKKSRFGDNLWRLDFRLNKVYAKNSKIIKEIVKQFSNDLLRYADIHHQKIGNLKRWHYNKKDHHPVVFLSDEEMDYFLISLRECDGYFSPLKLEVDDRSKAEESGSTEDAGNIQSNQESNLESKTINPTRQSQDDDFNLRDSESGEILQDVVKKHLVTVKGEGLMCGDVSVRVVASNIFGTFEKAEGVKIEYTEDNVCFIDPVDSDFLAARSWDWKNNISSLIHNQVKVDKKLIKAINKDAKYCGHATVLAGLIEVGMIDKGETSSVLPALRYSSSKGNNEFGIIHGAIDFDTTLTDNENYRQLCNFFRKTLTQISISDDFDEFRIPVILQDGLNKDKHSKMLLLIASSFAETFEEAVAVDLSLADKNIALCCDSADDQSSMIYNFRSIEFSRFGS